MEQSFNVFDLIFLSLVGVFSLVGLLRGFVKEGFSILNLILASLITVYTRPIITELLMTKIKLQIVADTISSAIVFTTCIIIISLITSNLSKALSEMTPSYVNNPIGLLFGFLKAYLIMAIVVVTMFSIYEVDQWGNGEEKLPSIMLEGRTYGFIRYGARLIRPVVNSFLKKKVDEQKDEITNLLNGNKGKEEGEGKEKNGNNSTGDNNKKKDDSLLKKGLKEEGYTDDQINKMDLLMNHFAK